MRDGLSLLDRLISTGVEPLTVELLEQFLGQPNSEKVYNLIAQIGDSSAAGTLAAAAELIETGLSEAQIVDSLIDYMRDLMVVKSAGAESELLALTDEQRKRTVELAEKFDTAGLVYNITALEKLRWTIKNSDTPRALLEATLLRFALSEHFLDVDALLSQLKGGADNAIKKKQPIRPKPQAGNEPQSHRAAEPQSNEQQTTKIEQRESRIENRGRTRSQSRNEIVSDPAVKTILMGLDATITDIEENR